MLRRPGAPEGSPPVSPDTATPSGSSLGWDIAEWVRMPYLSWRLRGRPYAAVVTSKIDFDALAWINGSAVAEQVDGLATDTYMAATKATLLLDAKE